MRIALSVSLAIAAAVAVTFLARDESPNSARDLTPPQSETQKPTAVEYTAANANAPSVITVTSKAAATIKKLVADQQLNGPVYLRVRVVPGGCMGFLHKLDLDREKYSDDDLFESAGVNVVVLKRQVEMLRGAEVDYGELDGKPGFKIENPNFKGNQPRNGLLRSKRKRITS